MNIEFEKQTTDIVVRAAALEVTDQESASAATELILAGKQLVQKIKNYFFGMKKAAWEAHQKVVQNEAAEIAKIQPAIELANSRLSAWRNEERRKFEAAEAERRRIAAEQQRLANEALKKVKDAEKKAEEDRLKLEAEAKKLQEEPPSENVEQKREEIRKRALENLQEVDRATDAAIDEAAKAEAALPPAPATEAPKTEGLAWRDNFQFEVTDPAAVPERYKVVDRVKLGKDVRALGLAASIPGVRVWNDPIPIKIGTRIN